MPYTNAVFDPAAPVGSSQLSAGDNAIRAAKLDIKERMETLVEDFDANPLALIAGLVGTIGAVAGKKMLIASDAFVPEEDQDDWTYFNDYVQTDDSGTRVLKAPVILPPGAIITEIEYLWTRDGALTGQYGVLCATDFDVATAFNELFFVEEAGAGVKLTSTGATSILIEDNKLYKILVRPLVAGALIGRVQLFGVRITYDTPSAEVTL